MPPAPAHGFTTHPYDWAAAIGHPVGMSRPAAHGRPLPVAMDIAIVAVGVVAAAAAVPATLLASLAALVAAGVAVGVRRESRWRWIAVGAMAGALVIFAWTLAVEPPSDPLASLRTGGSSAIAFGLIVGAGFVLPGYLFGCAYRRSAELPLGQGAVDPDERTGQRSVRSSIALGCLILAVDVAVILSLSRTFSQLGP